MCSTGECESAVYVVVKFSIRASIPINGVSVDYPEWAGKDIHGDVG